jgi:hypothetical protein
MTDRWVCPVQLTPRPGPFAAGSTPQPTGAVPESPEHDKKVWEAAVELRLPAEDVTNATNSNPVFTAATCAGVLFLYEVSIERLCGAHVFPSLTCYQRLDGLTSFYEIW